MTVVTVHQDQVRFVQLPCSMQMVNEPLSILSKQEFVYVSFLGPSHHDSSGAMCSPRVMVFAFVDYQGRQCKACNIDIGQHRGSLWLLVRLFLKLFYALETYDLLYFWHIFWTMFVNVPNVFGSVISSCFSTFSYFLYQANTELFLVAFAHAMDKFVTVSLTFNWGYLFKRKPNHFLPASLCTLLKPSNPLASAKENAIFLTSLPDKGKSKNEYSCIISTISSENKELTCYRGCTWFSLKSTLQVQWFGLVYLHALWGELYCFPFLQTDDPTLMCPVLFKG